MYKTEHDFSKSFSDRLAKARLMVTRIESHNTGNGIPDIFVCGRGIDTWLEQCDVVVNNSMCNHRIEITYW